MYVDLLGLQIHFSGEEADICVMKACRSREFF